MADERLNAWEKLFGHALAILDESVAAGAPESGWSFGGGTVLMRRYRHRISRDVEVPARIAPILRARRDPLTKRLVTRDAALREDFAALDTLDFSPSYDECVAILRRKSGDA